MVFTIEVPELRFRPWWGGVDAAKTGRGSCNTIRFAEPQSDVVIFVSNPRVWASCIIRPMFPRATEKFSEVAIW